MYFSAKLHSYKFNKATSFLNSGAKLPYFMKRLRASYHLLYVSGSNSAY